MQQKIIIIIVLIFCTAFSFAQQKSFLRLYGPGDSLFTKGHFAGTTDSSIMIDTRHGIREIKIKDVMTIRTHRPQGHNALIGGLIGGLGLGIIGLASGEKKQDDGTLGGAFHDAFTVTPGAGFAGGLILGGGLGAGIGALTAKPSQRKIFIVNGSLPLWQLLKADLDEIRAKH
ncbi:MAG: hypothetical protein ABIY51_13785 [Ferruginibacter sp.]